MESFRKDKSERSLNGTGAESSRYKQRSNPIVENVDGERPANKRSSTLFTKPYSMDEGQIDARSDQAPPQFTSVDKLMR